MRGAVGVSGEPYAGVFSAALTDRYLYIAGFFEHVGPPCGNWVAFDLATGSPVPGGPVVGGRVATSTSDGAGGWFLGGEITGVNGTPRQRLAHLLSDGTLSPWAPAVSGSVAALERRGNTLYVGGEFTGINGVYRPNLAAIDATTGAILPWGSGTDYRVEALLAVEDTLFVGGSFRTIHGVERSSLAALDAIDGSVLPWSIAFTGSPFAIGTPYVTRIVQDGARLYVGGDFNAIAGLATGSFAAIERATAMVVPGSSPVGYGTTGIVVHGGRIYVSGPFTNYTEAGAGYGLVALSRSTLQLLPWVAEQPRYHRTGSAIAASGDRIFVGEGWDHPNYAIDPLCAVDTTTGALRPFADSLRSAVGPATLQIAGGRLFVGGLHQNIAAVPRRSLAEIDLRDGQLTARSFELPAGDYSQYVATDGQRVFAWSFASQLFGFDPASGSAPIWVKAIPDVRSMLSVHGRLFVLGSFSLPDGGTRQGVGEIDPASGDVLPWAPAFANPGSYVSFGSLVTDSTRLYVGGSFTTVDGVPHEGIVAFRLSDLSIEPTAFGPISSVVAIAASDNRVFALGDRVGWPQPSLFAFDRQTGAALPWAPLASTGGELTPYSWSGLLVSNGELIVANTLTVGGGPFPGQHRLFRTSLTASTWSPYPFAPDYEAYGIAGRDGVLAVVGAFNTMGPNPASNVALFTWPSVGVPPSKVPTGRTLSLWPDPVRERLTLRLAPAHGESRRVDIFDVSGRLVHSLTELPEAGGEVSWDLRRSDGSHTAPGVHFAVVREGVERRASARFVVIR